MYRRKILKIKPRSRVVSAQVAMMADRMNIPKSVALKYRGYLEEHFPNLETLYPLTCELLGGLLMKKSLKQINDELSIKKRKLLEHLELLEHFDPKIKELYQTPIPELPTKAEQRERAELIKAAIRRELMLASSRRKPLPNTIELTALLNRKLKQSAVRATVAFYMGSMKADIKVATIKAYESSRKKGTTFRPESFAKKLATELDLPFELVIEEVIKKIKSLKRLERK